MSYTRSQEQHRRLRNDYDANALRSRRVQINLQICKKRRADDVSKHRNVVEDDLVEDVEMLDISMEEKPFFPEKVMKSLFSANVFEQSSALYKVSRQLWRKPKEALAEITKMNLVPRFLQMLQSNHKLLQVTS